MIKTLHVTGQLEPGGISSWIKALLSKIDPSALSIDICCNYRVGVGLLAADFAALGCKIHHIPLDFNLPRYQSALAKLVTSGGYQIVHDHRSFLSGATMRAAKKAGVKARIVYHHTPNDDTLPDLPRQIYQAILKRWTLKYATNIWGCSNAALTAHYGTNWRDKDKRLDVVYGAVSFAKPKHGARSEIRKEFGTDPNDKVIGFVARMTSAKNPVVAFEVCQRIMQEDPNVSVLWVGDGPLLQRIKDEVARSTIGNRFHFTGMRSDIPDLLSAMDVYLQPSIWEGLPLGTLEALHAGLPVIGSRAPGLLEALPQEFWSLCSDADDIEGHVRVFFKIMNSKTPISSPGLKARLEEFSPEAFYKRIMSRYEGALGISGHD